MFNLEILDYTADVLSLLMIRQDLQKSCCTTSITMYVKIIAYQDYNH